MLSSLHRLSLFVSFSCMCALEQSPTYRFEEFEAHKAGREWIPNPYKNFEDTLCMFRSAMARLAVPSETVRQNSLPCPSSSYRSERGGGSTKSSTEAKPDAIQITVHSEDESLHVRPHSMTEAIGEKDLPKTKRRRAAGCNESIWSCPEFSAQAFWLAGGGSEKLQ